MWCMVRILKRNRVQWALNLLNLDALKQAHATCARNAEIDKRDLGRDLTAGEFGKVYEVAGDLREFNVYRAMNSYHREAVVSADALVNTYLFTYFKDLCDDPDINVGFKDGVNHNKARIEVVSLVQSCVEEGFIVRDAQEEKRLSLTSKGKKFAGLDGLLKAEITELGNLQFVLVTVVTTIAAVRFDLIISSIQHAYYSLLH